MKKSKNDWSMNIIKESAPQIDQDYFRTGEWKCERDKKIQSEKIV